MSNRPTIRQLQYLCALAEHSSFREAAEACLVSQSTLSAGIIQLEESMQARLIDRDSVSFRFTYLGEQMLEKAQNLLRDVDDMVALVQSQDAPLSGRLRVCAIPSIGSFLLPRALPSLRQAYSGLEFYLREALSRDVLAGLRKGQFDAGIIALPYRIEGFAHRSLGRDLFEVAVPKGHRFCKRASLTAPELLEENLVLLEDGHCLRDHILSSLNRGSWQRSDLMTTSLMMIVQMVANGLGVTLLPKIAVKAGLVQGLDLELIPLEDDLAAEREIVLIWREHSSQERDFHLLADHLSGFIGER